MRLDGDDSVLLAWDKDEDLELSFYYFNPILVYLMIMYSHAVYEQGAFDLSYLALGIICVFMFRCLEWWNKRVESDRKIHQKELEEFYNDKIRVKIFYKTVEEKED